jgi:hypothetical protein
MTGQTGFTTSTIRNGVTCFTDLVTMGFGNGGSDYYQICQPVWQTMILVEKLIETELPLYNKEWQNMIYGCSLAIDGSFTLFHYTSSAGQADNFTSRRDLGK